MSSIDRYPLGLRGSAAARKQVIDAYLASFRDGDMPTIGVPVLQAIMAIILIGVVAGVIMFYVGFWSGRESERSRAASAEQQLLDCMNGRATWSYPNGTGKGYGRTVVKCSGAEEYAL